MPRMRTVQQTAIYFKEMDQKTAVNETMLRRLLKENKIQYVKIGAKYLINLDWFESWLLNPVVEAVSENHYGKLRKI